MNSTLAFGTARLGRRAVQRRTQESNDSAKRADDGFHKAQEILIGHAYRVVVRASVEDDLFVFRQGLVDVYG